MSGRFYIEKLLFQAYVKLCLHSGEGGSRSLSELGFTTSVEKYDAFTLAEVLITLGIIGIVAAMTLPALINKNQEKVLETQYAKAKTVLTNGYKLMMAKTENFKVDNLPFVNNCNQFNEKACMSKEHKIAFNIVADSANGLDDEVLPKDYVVQGETEKSPFSWDEVPYIFATADGVTYGVLPDEELTSFSVVADVNGLKNPNTVRKDLYKFRYSGNGLLADVSSELEEINKCSADNLSGCKTSEACLALQSIPREDGSCPAMYWYNENCIIENWGSYYCR